MNKIICPDCNKEGVKVIAWAMPMYFCENCHTLWGFWSFFHFYITAPIESLFGGFSFMTYEGSYWRALWDWFFDKE